MIVPAPEELTWKETRRRLKIDRDAFYRYLGTDLDGRRSTALFHPSYQCVALYRISRFFFVRGYIYVSRFFWHLNLLLTGADIPAISDIGEGACILHPAGCVLVGRIGKNLFCHGQCGMGGGRAGAVDADANSGMPILGDNVELGFNCVVLGGLRIGNDVRIGFRAFVSRDVPDGMTVTSTPPVRRRVAAGASAEVPDAAL